MAFDFTQLLDASLDGVPFYVNRGSRQGGRRTITHEFPGREDDGEGEDLGKLPTKFSLDAFVIGANMLLDRDALIKVLEEPGPKLLTHPGYGEIVVDLVGGYQTDENLNEGVIRISVKLTKHGDPIVPRFLLPSIPAAADHVIVLTEVDFEKKWKPNGFRSSLLQALGQVNGALRKVRGKINSELAFLDDLAAEFDELDRNLASLIDTPNLLAAKLTGLTASIFGLLGTISDALTAFERPRLALEVGEDMITFATTEDAGEATTPRRLEQAANLAAVNEIANRAALGELGRSLETMEHESAADAVFTRSEFTRLARLVTDAEEIEGETYDAIETVRAAVSRDLTQNSQAAPVVFEFVLRAPTPAVVLAQRFYGDASRWEEIARRNGAENPLILPPDVTLEVVLDGSA